MLPFDKSLQSFQSYFLLDTMGSLSEGNEDEPNCLQQNALRTQLLLLDYKQFKAARTIQRHFRGFNARNTLTKIKMAALVVQRYWRYFTSKRRVLLMAQELTQNSVILNYNLNSLKIQAFFRGWWSRKYVNNMQLLKEIRLNCMEDLLNGFVSKLHTDMRTGHLPGCMDYRRDYYYIIEDLLATLNYRFLNHYVIVQYIKSTAGLHALHSDFRDSVLWTLVPYFGYDQTSDCHLPPLCDTEPKRYGERERDVIQTFLKATRITTVQRNKLNKLKMKIPHVKPESESQSNFCKDLVKSMKFWNVCKICQVKVTDSLMTVHFETFLNDIKSHLEDLKYVVNCNCREC